MNNQAGNQLYEFTVKAMRGAECELPEGALGAYIPCYVFALDYQTALKKGATTLKDMGYLFDSVQGKVREIPPASWSSYVAKVWPDFADQLPSTDELPLLMKKGAIFFGPFITF